MEEQEFFDKIMFSIEDHLFGTMSYETFRDKMLDLFYETQVEEDKYKDEIESLVSDLRNAENDTEECEAEIKDLKQELADAEKEIDRLKTDLYNLGEEMRHE